MATTSFFISEEISRLVCSNIGRQDRIQICRDNDDVVTEEHIRLVAKRERKVTKSFLPIWEQVEEKARENSTRQAS